MNRTEAKTKHLAGAVALNGNGAHAADEREELAQVVVSKASEHVPQRPWYLVLRPWLCCLAILALVEIGVRPADQLCILLKLLPAKPDMIVITANLTTFTDESGDDPMLHIWLADNLPQRPVSVPAPAKLNYKDAIEGALRDFVEKHARL